MKNLEKKFLLTVERGDIQAVKELLSHKDKFNINCSDPLARNALIIAINKTNLEIIKLLLEAEIEIGDALMYAIDEEFVEAVELLLAHQENIVDTNFSSRSRQDNFFSCDMTPLTLAAHRNNFEIIRLLLDRKATPIVDPHDPRCSCEACCRAQDEDCLEHSRSRINAYRALASPCLLALSNSDPLLAAFRMSERLENLAKMEPEYKEVYLRLRSQCQTFATRLIDHTRTSKDLEILLNHTGDEHNHQGEVDCGHRESIILDSKDQQLEMSSMNEFMSTDTNRNLELKLENELNNDITSLGQCCDHDQNNDSNRLARLKLAIECKQKTFCAHPNIQELLATMWYEGLPGFRNKNFIAQTCQVICIGSIFPIYSIAYLLAPNTSLGRYIKRPFIKFICHSASYITFLIILILASQRVEAFYSWSNVLELFKPFIKQSQHEQNPDLTNLNVDSMTIDDLTGLYKQLGSVESSSARSFDSLSKIFGELPASSKKRGTMPSPIETVIVVWVISLIWAEFKQLQKLGMNYYRHDMWNILDSIASAFYIGAIILRVISYCESNEKTIGIAREHWNAYDPTLLSEGLFATATIFSALKLVYIFSLNPYLGPLQISLGRMIIDILRFSWIYMLVLFAFACGMNQLLWYYADLERHKCLNVTNYSLAQYYSGLKIDGFEVGNSSSILNGNSTANSTSSSLRENIAYTNDITLENQEDPTKPPVTIDDSCKSWRHFSNVFESSQTLFWANFGLVDLENFDLTGIRQYTRFWALLMFGCYCFINVIVVLNLLIAMMNHSYVKISNCSDIEWKFARTRLWMSYFDSGSTVPVPFNILPSIKIINKLCTFLLRPLFCLVLGSKLASKCYRVHHRRQQLDCTSQSYRRIIRSLIRRYLVHEQRILEKKRELTEAKLNRWARWEKRA